MALRKQTSRRIMRLLETSFDSQNGAGGLLLRGVSEAPLMDKT